MTKSIYHRQFKNDKIMSTAEYREYINRQHPELWIDCFDMSMEPEIEEDYSMLVNGDTRIKIPRIPISTKHTKIVAIHDQNSFVGDQADWRDSASSTPKD